jgi:broad specificity phosphatase PhoE
VTDIVLVRHGETTWHAENRYAGGSDIPLTPRGIEQARQLARWAGAAGVDGVWASNLSRAMLTAQPCAEAAGLEMQVDARLRELDFGRGEGLTQAQMAEAMPDALAAFLQDPVAHHLPAGENPKDAAERGLACLYDIAAAHPSRRVLVVCHTTIIRLMICSLLGLPLGEYRRLLPAVHNGFLNEIRLRHDGVALLSWNAPPV